jgi:ABC-type polar amino acid transport system ATPase subunit
MASALSRLPEEQSPPERSDIAPIIRFDGVFKHFGNLPVLEAINLDIRRGEHVALIGPSGCGKTTLLRCINALERLDSGVLIVNGQDLNDPALDVNRFRARIGLVFQQYNLFPHLTVLENIVLAPMKVRKTPHSLAAERAHQLLKQVGIGDKAHVYPDKLSGGQKQRVAIARALAMDPDILLLDEPTSALDPPMSREVLSVIADVQKGMTVVMVTHELRFVAQMADRLVYMEDGRIVETGPPDEILKNPQEDATRRYLEIFNS